MCIALKDNGVIYTSFKYSNFEGERNGRYFTDFMEDTFREFVKVIPELTVEDQWITLDVRPGRGEEKWLNLILRKIRDRGTPYRIHRCYDRRQKQKQIFAVSVKA